MGSTPRADSQGDSADGFSRRSKVDSRTFVVVRGAVGSSPPAGPRQQHAIPGVGDRFGKLTVTGHVVGKRGTLVADRPIVVQCDCGVPEYGATVSNLRSGKTKCCMLCGIKNAVATRKAYVRYREVIADDDVRNSLLQRINGIWRRCYHQNSDSYRMYGARGIRCWWFDQYGVGAVRKIDKAVWRRKMLEYLVTLPGYDVRGHEIDRIDNDKGYEPGNLRFVPRAQNLGNKRSIFQLQQRIAELEAENAELRRRAGL